MKSLVAMPAQPDARDFNVYARSLMLGKGFRNEATSQAEASGASPRVVSVLRAASEAGTTTDPQWAGNLVEYKIIASGFMESLRSSSAFDHMLPSMKRVPIGFVSIVAVTSVMVGNAVGEAKPKPVSQLSLSSSDVEPQKVAAIVVLSQDLVKFAPGAEGFIGSELKKAVSAGSDAVFLAGLADAAAAVPGSADLGADLAAMLAAIDVSAASALFLVMAPVLAGQLAAKTGVNGFVYPQMSPSGGSLAGIPVLTSDGMVAGQVLLVDASRIAADPGTVVLDSTTHATLVMDDAPADGAPATVSLWQKNLLGLRAERYLSFVVVGNAAAIADGVTWGTATP